MPTELDEQFRNIISMRNKINNQQAFKKGDLRVNVEEAIRDWVAKQIQVIDKRAF